MKKILLIVLLFVSIGATAQSRIISGIGERPAGITAARQWLYFNSPQGEYTNFEISVSCEGSGQIYYFTFETGREFQHNYQLPANGFFCPKKREKLHKCITTGMHWQAAYTIAKNWR